MKNQKIKIIDDGKIAKIYLNEQQIKNVKKYEIERHGGSDVATIKIEFETLIDELLLEKK